MFGKFDRTFLWCVFQHFPFIILPVVPLHPTSWTTADIIEWTREKGLLKLVFFQLSIRVRTEWKCRPLNFFFSCLYFLTSAATLLFVGRCLVR